ncbi:CDP-diacylglycerol--serine O-phosphatidyltransferase [Gemmatimonas sp.]|jgi:CDP-diacylglycerol--serine O-phosphatidyltransferase|uniref:CDP-diacylglycerol--serine O-phosphatidyltransferase n=1 Tax=Gemmatimonas sp. TaxID=1962908 RepID=UPI0037C0B6C4
MNAPDGTERQRMRPREAAVIALPNGFTLANLFFGIFGIVAASRGDFDAAARFIVFGGVADTLDGRIARATKTGSRFGEELDSLVDAISFGTAPALIMYFAVFQSTRWEWIFCFFFTACAVMRLARFNVMQAGRKTTHFQGLPSPAAGGVLATYYWFSQTSLYTETIVADLPWHQMLRFLMLGLGMLMISNVQYAKFPVVNFRSLQGILGFVLVIGTLIGVIFLPKQFFFPAGMAYVLYGIGRTVFLGLLDRLPGRDASGDDDDEDSASAPPRRRRRRRPSQRNPAGSDTGREDKPA